MSRFSDKKVDVKSSSKDFNFLTCTMNSFFRVRIVIGCNFQGKIFVSAQRASCWNGFLSRSNIEQSPAKIRTLCHLCARRGESGERAARPDRGHFRSPNSPLTREAQGGKSPAPSPSRFANRSFRSCEFGCNREAGGAHPLTRFPPLRHRSKGGFGWAATFAGFSRQIGPDQTWPPRTPPGLASIFVRGPHPPPGQHRREASEGPNSAGPPPPPPPGPLWAPQADAPGLPSPSPPPSPSLLADRSSPTA